MPDQQTDPKAGHVSEAQYRQALENVLAAVRDAFIAWGTLARQSGRQEPFLVVQFRSLHHILGINQPEGEWDVCVWDPVKNEWDCG